MRPTDITRLRWADVFVTLGGVAWMREVADRAGRLLFYCYRAMVPNRSLRGNKTSIVNGLVPYSGQDRHCYFIVINNGPVAG